MRKKEPNISKVVHPLHYNVSPARCKSCETHIECIDVVQHMNFNRGSAIKYIWRAGIKSPSEEAQDLEKARQYLEFEIARITRGA